MRSNNKVKINVQLHNTQHYKQIVGFKEYICTMYVYVFYLHVRVRVSIYMQLKSFDYDANCTSKFYL